MEAAEGPCLLETAARVQGSVDLPAVRAALGTSQLDQLVELYLEPTRHTTRRADEAYVRRCGARWVQLISPACGRVEAIPLEADLRRLPTFFALQLRVAAGQQLRRTVDLFTSPGELFLVGEPHDLERDYRRARAIEKSGWKLSACDPEAESGCPVAVG
jgi:hypothetical protein